MKYFTEDISWIEKGTLEEFAEAMEEDWGFSAEMISAHLAAMDSMEVGATYVITMSTGDMTIKRLS